MNSLLKKLLMITLLTPTFAFAQTSVDKVVATVAGEPITAQEVQERVEINMAILNQQKGKAVKLTKAEQTEISRGSFNELILERVLLNRAKTTGINIPDSEVNTEINNIAKGNNISTDELKKSVLSRGGEKGWGQFNRDLKIELTKAALEKREVLDKIKVSPVEVDSFLTSKKLGANNPLPQQEVVEVKHFFIEGTNAAALKKAQAAKAKITAGETFESVTASMSDIKDSGDKTVFITLDDSNADKTVIEAVKKLKDGEISNIVKAKNGLHIFKIIAHKTDELSLEEQKAIATELLTAQKSEEELKKWYSDLMTHAQKNLIEIKN